MTVLQQHFRRCSKPSPCFGTQTNGFQNLPVHAELQTQAHTDDPWPGAGLWMQQRWQLLHWHPHTHLGHCGHTGTQCQGNCQPKTQPSSSAQEEAPQAWRWRELCLACFCSHTINKRNWNICPELPCDAQWVSLADWWQLLKSQSHVCGTQCLMSWKMDCTGNLNTQHGSQELAAVVFLTQCHISTLAFPCRVWEI